MHKPSEPIAHPARKLLLGGLLLGAAALAQAHEPIAKCVQLDPQTVRCRGGYAHKEDAPGKLLDVIAVDGNAVIVAGKLGPDSTFTFKKPAQPYYVLFDAGPGHQAVVEQEEIGPLPEKAKRQKWMQAP